MYDIELKEREKKLKERKPKTTTRNFIIDSPKKAIIRNTTKNLQILNETNFIRNAIDLVFAQI